MARSIVAVVRGSAVVATVAFLVVLLRYLLRPGYTPLRLLFFAALGGLAVAGAVGVVRGIGRLIAIGVAGLLLLGFWQAVLWVYALPVAGVLALAGLLDDRR